MNGGFLVFFVFFPSLPFSSLWHRVIKRLSGFYILVVPNLERKLGSLVIDDVNIHNLDPPPGHPNNSGLDSLLNM